MLRNPKSDKCFPVSFVGVFPVSYGYHFPFAGTL